MKKEIVFIDMDGTFYQTANDVIQPSSIEAVQVLEGDGMQVFAATGRPLGSLTVISHLNVNLSLI